MRRASENAQEEVKRFQLDEFDYEEYMEKAENEQIAGEKLELQYLEHDRLLAI